MMSFGISLVIQILKIYTCVYEVLTFPIYNFFQKKIKFMQISNRAEDKSNCRIMAETLNNDPAGEWFRLDINKNPLPNLPPCETLDDYWYRAVQLWPNSHALGTRQLLDTVIETQDNGRQFKKLSMGEYFWETYADVHKRIDNLGKGLLSLGLRPRVDKVIIFSETRAEWMVTAQACMRFNFPLVTWYATLGADAVIDGIAETEATTLVTSEELLAKMTGILQKCKTLRQIIFVNNAIFEKCGGARAASIVAATSSYLPSGCKLFELAQVEKMGSDSGKIKEDHKSPSYKPKIDDLAVIMYTSGSTGRPKGVEITHGNLVSGISGFYHDLPAFKNGLDTYIGYLPLAHVMELMCEILCISLGVRIGYSSPLTLTDVSNKIKSGSKGDITVLKPTMFVCVPIILDRVAKGVWEKVTDAGPMFLAIFKWLFEYKRSRLQHGYQSIFMDRLVFSKIRKLLGGQVRFILSGGAPMSAEAQDFVNVCFCSIFQGYGLTETCAAGCLLIPGDLRTGLAGAPVSSVSMRLRDWKESGYSPYDQPRPRGEILIGGPTISRGYYKQPEKTAEDFFVDKNGKRWFCTGDIGEFHADGSLSIIDRKKDLVKLQGGEYVSLGKVELAIASSDVVENTCVYADSIEAYTVALIVPKKKQLKQLALSKNLIVGDDLPALCERPEVVDAVLKDIQKKCVEKKLQTFEIPTKIYLDPEPWTPDTGLVTDAMKLRRRDIKERFQNQIDRLYHRKRHTSLSESL